jgi:inorganic pyrophosphatase
LQRSFTTRQPAASELYQLYRQRSYPNEIKARFGCCQLYIQFPIPSKILVGELFLVNKSPLIILELENFILDLSLIPAQPKFGIINVLIEISAGSKNKYEFDKDLNAMALDRVLSSSVHYPCDYGFIPNTLGNDGDPLDAMIIIDEPTFPGCVIAARPIGMLEMIDGGDRDEKILCVADKDPNYAHVKSLKDIPQHRLDEISEFFKTYKNLEKKVTEILGWKDVDAVMPLVQECVAAAKK